VFGLNGSGRSSSTLNQQLSYPRVLVSRDEDALFFEGPALPVLFLSAADIERWCAAPTKALMRPINGPACISTLTVLLDAHAQFVVLSDSRPPAARQGSLCLEFKTTGGMQVACVDDDRIVIIDHKWFERRGCHLVVGPTLYHAATGPATNLVKSPVPPSSAETQLRRAHVLAQIFTTL
jgi:hypothetical protein